MKKVLTGLMMAGSAFAYDLFQEEVVPYFQVGIQTTNDVIMVRDALGLKRTYGIIVGGEVYGAIGYEDNLEKAQREVGINTYMGLSDGRMEGNIMFGGFVLSGRKRNGTETRSYSGVGLEAGVRGMLKHSNIALFGEIKMRFYDKNGTAEKEPVFGAGVMIGF